VVVVSGTRIIARDVLENVPARFVNLHAGITPAYRGVHGGYWALADGRPEACGVTIHLVDAGIDTGAVLAQAPIRPSLHDNFTTYPLLQLAAGLPLLVDVVRRLQSGEAPQPIAAPPGPSRLHSHPTLWQYLYYRITRRVR
jgi:methionyl-tRNA formyltransferase